MYINCIRDFMNRFENNKNLTGKLLFVISIVVLGFMVYLLFTKPFLSVDEWFTNGLVKLRFGELVAITSSDVHPPLYYLIVKGVLKVSAFLGMQFNEVILIKSVSVIPYIILLAVSLTKIRKEYGWYACGLFSLSTILMSSFFIYYLTARMYSWGLAFIIFSFIFVLNILKKPQLKDWILLSVFSVLAAYCFYATAITSVCIYLFLLIYVLLNNKSEIRNFAISCVLNVVLYIPWLFTLLNQVSGVKKSYWIKTPTLESSINALSSAFPSFGFALSCIFTVIIVLAAVYAIKRYYDSRETDDYYILSGILVFIGTVVASIVISLLFKPILLPRILVPAAGVFWLAFSIAMSKLEFNKTVLLFTVLLIVIGAAGIANQCSDISAKYDETVEMQNLLSEINTNSSIVIFDMMTKYVRFYDDLNETHQFYKYTIDNKTHRPDYITTLGLKNYNFDFSEDVAENSDKDIYFIIDKNSQLKLPDNVNSTEVAKIYNIQILNITQAS